MKSDVIITFNNGRKILFLFIIAIFTFLPILFLVKADSLVPFWVIRSAWFLRMVGLLGTIVIGSMFLVYLRVLFRKTALIVNGEGIIDASSAGGEAGLIKWNEIEDIQQYTTPNTTVIRIIVTDPERVIKNANSWLVRWSLRRNYNTYRTPVVIPMVLLNSYVDSLELMLRDRLYEFRKNSNIQN